MRKVFLALIIAAISTTAAFAQNQVNKNTPTGSWIGVVTAGPGGPPPFRVLVNFTADGGFTGSGDGDSFAGGSPQYGVWERVGGANSRRFAATFLQLFYDANSNATLLGKVRQTVILDKSGNAWQGPGIVDLFAPDGSLIFSGTATATATRIQSEPLSAY
ncbi:MAG: hypothetical protein M3449_10440 [Acidobacteriota bacterium]|nr:hypothetical protein [Acidobacteriota bacterium]